MHACSTAALSFPINSANSVTSLTRHSRACSIHAVTSGAPSSPWIILLKLTHVRMALPTEGCVSHAFRSFLEDVLPVMIKCHIAEGLTFSAFVSGILLLCSLTCFLSSA